MTAPQARRNPPGVVCGSRRAQDRVRAVALRRMLPAIRQNFFAQATCGLLAGALVVAFVTVVTVFAAAAGDILGMLVR